MTVNGINFHHEDDFWALQFLDARGGELLRLLAHRGDYENLGAATAAAIGYVLSLPSGFKRSRNPVGRISPRVSGGVRVEWEDG
jgi:hypothetical protein